MFHVVDIEALKNIQKREHTNNRRKTTKNFRSPFFLMFVITEK